MNNVTMLDYSDASELLQSVIDNRIPAILSYMSKNKWHVAKVLITDISGPGMNIEPINSGMRYQPINIQEGQPVGLSFKYSYGKFVIDTTVQDLILSGGASGGQIVLCTPDQIIAIQRRSYFRVSVPNEICVNAVVWPRRGTQNLEQMDHQYCEGVLVDLSCGGAQIAVAQPSDDNPSSNRPEFRQGQFIGVRFTPLPYEKPLMFDAQIRNILPTADNQAICLGLQLVGLEASDEGRATLKRVAEIVDKYHQMNEGQLDPAEVLATASESESESIED